MYPSNLTQLQDYACETLGVLREMQRRVRHRLLLYNEDAEQAFSPLSEPGIHYNSAIAAAGVYVDQLEVLHETINLFKGIRNMLEGDPPSMGLFAGTCRLMTGVYLWRIHAALNNIATCDTQADVLKEHRVILTNTRSFYHTVLCYNTSTKTKGEDHDNT